MFFLLVNGNSFFLSVKSFRFIIFLLLFYYNNKTYRTKLGYASFPAYPTKILHT
nr:MAG TPA: hypothetical protein [Caudoviricetes sp.]